MFSVGDARRYPGFFTRTWTPPPGGTSPHPSRSQGSRSAAFAHETPPPLTPRLATPISVRGLSASDPVSQLYNARVRENDAQASRALVGISREEPDISPHVSTLDAPCSSWCNKTHAGRNGWEDMSPEERMAYTTRLEEDLGHVQSTLDQAYQLRDHYKEEAARLHKELMQKKRTLERLECDHRNCENIISRYQRQEAELRQQLDIVEGEVERLKALLQSGEERQYNSMLGTEGELWQKQREVLNLQEERRKLEEQINSLKTELSLMHPTSVTRDIAVKQPQRSFLTEEGTEEEEIGQAHNVTQLLRNELQDLRQQLHGARSEQERTLGEVINQRNALQGVNTSLREELEGLKEMCSSQNMTINEMNEALSRRACLTHQEHQALVKRCEELFNELQRLQIRDTDSINRTIEMEKQIIQQNLFTLRMEGDEKDSLLRKAHADLAKMRDHIKKLETELDAARSDKANLEQEFTTTRIQLQHIQQNNRNSDNLKEELQLTIESQLSTIQQLRAKIEKLEHQVADISAAEMPQRTPKSSSREERTHTQLLSSPAQVTRQMEETVSDQCVGQQDPHFSGQQYPSPEDINHMYDELASARATVDQMSADRNTQAARVAELTAAVARLEENVDSPGRVVEALTTELRETQERLRDAEEEASRLSERLRDAEQRCESAAAVRSAGVGLEQQLSSALAALEQLAEEREAVATRCVELEGRVAELDHQLRESQTACDTSGSEAAALRDELASARATVDQMSADRNTQAARVAELTAAVARLEENVDSPGRVVEALTTELRETQERLRDAEEEASRLSERLRDAEQRCESAAAVRSAGVGLEQQLSSALAALEQLAEEREAVATRCVELEGRVAELDHQLRESQTACDTSGSEAAALRDELASARATVDQMSADRNTQAARVAELTAAVARLEENVDSPGRVVEALTTELRETQERLRDAEEEASRLSERLRDAEQRCESAAAVRSAGVGLEQQLSSALAALEQLAEEREAVATRCVELEGRVAELDHQLRESQTACDTSGSEAAALRDELASARATVDQMSADRNTQAARVAELTAAVARLEENVDSPGRVVEALTTELRETQERLRDAEEEASRLSERLRDAEQRCESAAAVRSAGVGLEQQLSSALAALEQLAEEREAVATRCVELEGRVAELDHQLRDSQTACDTSGSEAAALRDELASARATVDQMSADRNTQAARVAELTAAVARLEENVDSPGRVVEALTTELRETQERLRDAEEEASRLSERLRDAEQRCESAAAVRSAGVGLEQQLSSALAALEQLAEEREAVATRCVELEGRVAELDHQLRDSQTACDTSGSEAAALRDELASARATVDQMSADRNTQAARVAELTAAVARLEENVDSPGRVVEALTTELRETQERLRDAEEEASRLSERLRDAEQRCESAAAVRSAGVGLEQQLSSALAALEQLAEEREAVATRCVELEGRVAELDHQLRESQTACDTSGSEAAALRDELASARATVDQMSAERNTQAARVAELTAAVARLEENVDSPGRVVEALTTELRETQERLRDAEEEASRLSERLRDAEQRCESAAAVRSAGVGLEQQLSSALAALEQLAEEREAVATRCVELEGRVAELDHQLRDSQTACDTSGSEAAALRDELASARATVDQMSADRNTQAARVAELTAAVARLEENVDSPGRVVEALTTELRETQERLRDAEEEASRLSERLRDAEQRCESAAAVRSAGVGLEQQLSSALAALEQLAEEREAVATRCVELEGRVAELDHQLRESQTACDTSGSEAAALRDELASARATVDQMSADRNTQAARVAELTAAVARLEENVDSPGRVVEALTTELRETQERLRDAEEEASRLSERLRDAEQRCESAAAVRSAGVGLEQQLSSALAALEQLAEEREAVATRCVELEGRVAELDHQLRESQTACDTSGSEAAALRDELASARATVDQMSADRNTQAARVAELTAAVARLEENVDSPGRVVEALTTELRETQERLRDAEEEASRLSERLRDAEQRCESAAAVRSAGVGLEQQLSSALAALEQLAEEREAVATRCVELEDRVAELDHQLRDSQTACDTSGSEAAALRDELASARATVDQMSADRNTQAARVAELTAAVARLEENVDSPGRVVEALTTELRETQERLRDAEEEASRLSERLRDAEQRCESAAAVRSAGVGLEQQLSSALAALEQLAEEREAVATRCVELEGRVAELDHQLRDSQTACDTSGSEAAALRDELASARATVDQMSADRTTQAARVAELTAAVARLEENVDSPGRVVEALTTELRETQERLRDAEEEASRLSERLRDAEQRCESAAAVRSAGVGLEQQLSSALAALEQLAEEREAVATRCVELEDRVAELSHDRDEARSSAALREAEANGLREECNMKAHLLSNALAALDQVAHQHAIAETVYDEQSSNLQRMFEALQEQFVVTKKGFEVQWERRVEASTAELMSARRSAQRAGEARKRAEENAAYCMRELERVHADLLRQQRDYRALERLLRSSGRLSTSRLDGDDDDDGTNCSGVRSVCRDTEGVELAQFLQISSLQVDLMLSRRNCHQLEARQEELQTALERSELQLASLPPSAEESYAELRRVRGQLESLQDEHRRLEERFETLKRERAEDVEQLQEQNERLVQQLREKRDKLASLTRQMRESELAAKQQTEELSDAFNLLEGQMRALREEVGIGQSESRQQGRARRPQRAKENTDVETMMLQSRIKFLEKTLKQKEEEIHCLQEELERNETQLDQFEDQMTLVTQRLETTSRKSTHLEQTVHELKRTNEELRGELDILKTRVLQRDERLSHRAVSVGATHRDARGSSPAPPPSQSEEAERATPTTAATPRGSRRLQGQRTPPAPASMSPTSGRRPAAKRARSIRGRT